MPTQHEVVDTNNESDTFYKPIFAASQNDLTRVNTSKEELGLKGV